ncbi:PilW family protein [Aliamphritea ceti]|uniref:PilW family protein n=1 Tax=Aliamphritea ceti TaxID=1524258 RepID=UPI0021C42ED1|nr:PilW family protein [Aliamphritea ceti]
MQSGLARLQENGRFATQFLTQDIRQAGYMGCSTNNSVVSTVIDDGGGLYDFIDFSNALEGLNNVDGTKIDNTITPLAGTDVITIKYADNSSSCTVDSHNPTAASIKCDAPHSYQKGDVLIVSDCSHTGIFQQSNTNNNATTATIVHNTGQGTPGNCTKGLGSPLDCSTTNGTAYAFPPGASVLKFQSYRYFIAENLSKEPALFRQGIQTNGGATLAYADPIELVEGVEDMQILYGIDDGSDNAPDRYVDGTTANGSFDDVTAVRISLLLQSNEEGIVSGTQTVPFRVASGASVAGPTANYSDGRLRKVFTTTIAIRNRI